MEQLIVSDPKVMLGKPAIKVTRITTDKKQAMPSLLPVIP